MIMSSSEDESYSSTDNIDDFVTDNEDDLWNYFTQYSFFME